MLMRTFEVKSVESSPSLHRNFVRSSGGGNDGRNMSIARCGGIVCLNISCVDPCMMMSYGHVKIQSQP